MSQQVTSYCKNQKVSLHSTQLMYLSSLNILSYSHLDLPATELCELTVYTEICVVHTHP